MWRLDRCEGATVFAAGCTLILPIPQNPGAGVFLNRGRLVFGATLVQHHRAFYSRKQPELRLIFRPGRVKKNPAAIETTGFFRGTPERISPLGDKPRIRGAQQKTCLTAGFFVVRPSGFPLSGINLESAEHSKKPASRQVFCGTPERIRTAGLQSRSLSLYPAELRAHIQQELL